MLSHNHYDVAFEAYLRAQKKPYVSVNENQRALWNQSSLKSMDFIVYSPQDNNLLIDVKGRQRSSLSEKGCRENWATRDDIECLTEWQKLFGQQFQAVLVFAYTDLSKKSDLKLSSLEEPAFEFRGRGYNFYGVTVDDFRKHMKIRSKSWDTVWMPSADYQRVRAPFRSFL